MLHCNVGWCIKGSAVHRSNQQCLVIKWLGLSVTVRVRAIGPGNGIFLSFFFLSVLKVTNTFVLHVKVAATFTV